MFIGNSIEELKVLKDDKIRLELSFGMASTLQFYYLIYDKDNNNIGDCGIRLLNNKKNQYFGNIEYEIYLPYRGNNYAEKACKLLSKVALYYNASKLTITANPNNIASNKTIQNLGARFIEIKRVPRRMKLYKTSKEVNIYEWDLEKGETK